jgi:hypothetical protein
MSPGAMVGEGAMPSIPPVRRFCWGVGGSLVGEGDVADGDAAVEVHDPSTARSRVIAPRRRMIRLGDLILGW